MLEVRIRTTAELEALRERARNPAPVLAMIGALVKAESQAAFDDQRFGDIEWLPRYPKQGEPFVNIAGVVQDFLGGAVAPDPRRFERRPAAVFSGTLQRSIAFEVQPRSVVIGSVVPYASAHNAGLVSIQPITDSVRAALATWLDSVTPRQKNLKRAPRAVRQQAQDVKGYRKKLGFIFNTELLETQIVARPFLGLTDTMQQDFPRAVERWIAGGDLTR